MSERCQRKNLRREDKIVITFGNQHTILLKNQVVRSNIRLEASYRIHEVSKSELPERRQRKSLRREDKIVTIFGDQQTTPLMKEVVGSISFKAS